MRKILLSFAVLGGLAAGTGVASAAPAALPGPVLDSPAQVQTVQYGPDWQARRDYWRARRYERWHRHEAVRREMWRERHGYPRYGYYRAY